MHTWHKSEDSFSSHFSPLLCRSQELNWAIRLGGSERLHLLSHPASPASFSLRTIGIIFPHLSQFSVSLLA